MTRKRDSWASSEPIRRTMQANRPRDTKPELALRSAAHRLGLRFRVGVAPLPWLRRTADMVFPRARLAVFLDGCFWHGCPDHYVAPQAHGDFWARKVAENRRRDSETDRLLREAGWTVLRIWEHEAPQDAAAKIRMEYLALAAAPARPSTGSPQPRSEPSGVDPA